MADTSGEGTTRYVFPTDVPSQPLRPLLELPIPIVNEDPNLAKRGKWENSGDLRSLLMMQVMAIGGLGIAARHV